MSIILFRMNTGELVIAQSVKNKQSYSLTNPMEVILKRLPDLTTSMILSPWLPIELVKEEVVEVLNSNIQYTLVPEEKLVKCFVKVYGLYQSVISEVKLRFEEKLDSLLEEDSDLDTMVSDLLSDAEGDSYMSEEEFNYIDIMNKKIH